MVFCASDVATCTVHGVCTRVPRVGFKWEAAEPACASQRWTSSECKLPSFTVIQGCRRAGWWESWSLCWRSCFLWWLAGRLTSWERSRRSGRTWPPSRLGLSPWSLNNSPGQLSRRETQYCECSSGKWRRRSSFRFCGAAWRKRTSLQECWDDRFPAEKN